MPTTKQIIEASLRTIGVIASGEEAKAHEINDALEAAKQMMDSWSNHGLMLYALTHETFSLTGNRTLTIGDGGDIDTTRPVAIE